VVTGGAGFIGSHLVDALSKKELNNTVIIIDDLSTGNIDNIRHHFEPFEEKSSLEKDTISTNATESYVVSYDERIIFIHGDIRDKHLVEHVFETYTPNYVFHLAAQISVPKSMNNPRMTHEINVNGFVNILEAARKNDCVQKIVFSSSCAVYGDPQKNDLPITEQVDVNPASPYATTKLIGEQYADMSSQVFGVSTLSLRYFNVYGPRQNPHGAYAAVIPTFINNVRQTKPLTIFGDGKQTRDFVFVTDVVQANMLAATSDETGVINIGSGDHISVNKLADLIFQIMDSKVDIIYEKYRSGDIIHSYADISAAKQKIGFTPSFSINDGLRKTVAWFIQ
jgi:UDP-glucose 4-epimerase